MNEEELRKEATATVEWESTPIIDRPLFVHAYITGAEPREKRIAELETQIEHLTKHLTFQTASALFEQVEEEVRQEQRLKELEEQIWKTMHLNEEIIKALKECSDYEWLPCHNGKAKYIYLQTVIDIVNEQFNGVKEHD